MYTGLIAVVDHSLMTPELVAELYRMIHAFQVDHIESRSAPGCSIWYMRITIKSLWRKRLECVEGFLRRREREANEAIRERDRYPRIDRMEYVDLCWRPGCFLPTVASALAHLKETTLFDAHGEEPHRIFSECTMHAGSRVSRLITHSIEMVDITEGETRYWTRILSWKLRTRFYSQSVTLDWDGDDETGYFDYEDASPHLGPFRTRQAAIEAASAAPV